MNMPHIALEPDFNFFCSSYSFFLQDRGQSLDLKASPPLRFLSSVPSEFLYPAFAEEVCVFNSGSQPLPPQ